MWKKGHLASVCRPSHTPQTPTKPIKSTNPSSTKNKPPTRTRTHWVDRPTTEQEIEHFPDDSLLKVQGQSSKPITVTPELNGKSLDMEVDTGAAVSLMSKTTQKKLFPQAKLQKTTMKLQTYTAEALSVLGTLH